MLEKVLEFIDFVTFHEMKSGVKTSCLLVLHHSMFIYY